VKIAMGHFPFLNHTLPTQENETLKISMKTSKEFIYSLRAICEVIFYLLLQGYRNTLEALRCKVEDTWSTLEKEEGRSELGIAIKKVDEAIRLATDAAEIDTAVKWKEAESMALAGSIALQERLVSHPSRLLLCCINKFVASSRFQKFSMSKTWITISPELSSRSVNICS
jgi:hypothetical protein